MDSKEIKTLENELKQDLLPWTMLLYAIIGYGMMMTEPPKGMSQAMPALGLLLLGAVATVWIMRQRYYHTSAWLMTIAPILVIVLISHHFPGSEAYHALLFPILGAALTLGPRACVATTLASSIILWSGRVFTGTPPLDILPFVTNLFVLWGTAFMICMGQRPKGR